MKSRFPKKLANDEAEKIFYKARRKYDNAIREMEILLECNGFSQKDQEELKQCLITFKRMDLLAEASSEKILNEKDIKIKVMFVQDLLKRAGAILREPEQINFFNDLERRMKGGNTQ